MAIPLCEVLSDPSLLPARPTLLCGDEKRLVRWVHSSEVWTSRTCYAEVNCY